MWQKHSHSLQEWVSPSAPTSGISVTLALQHVERLQYNAWRYSLNPERCKSPFPSRPARSDQQSDLFIEAILNRGCVVEELVGNIH